MLFTKLLILSLVHGISPIDQLTAEQLEVRWRSEYPAAEAELQAVEQRFLAKGTLRIRTGVGQIIECKDLTVAGSGDKCLIWREQQTSDSRSATARNLSKTLGKAFASVECRTPEAYFVLSKSPNSDQYLIKEWTDRPQPLQLEIFENNYCILARNATNIVGRSLANRLKDTSFVVNSIRVIKVGDPIVRVTYSWRGEKLTETGWIDLNSERSWAICGYEVDLRGVSNGFRWLYQGKVEYSDSESHRLFPVRAECFARSPKNETAYEQTNVHFDQVVVGEVPDSLFHLTGYGLPDVPLRPQPRSTPFTFRSPAFWVTLFSTVVFFGLLWFLRARKAKLA